MISRFCARLMLRLSEFPLAPALGSTGSAERCRPLFACFTATMAESDFSRLFVIGFGTFLLPLRPRATARRPRDLPGPDEVLLNVPWFLDPRDAPFRLTNAASGCCLHQASLARHILVGISGLYSPGPFIPLPTLHLTSHDGRRTARGESGG